MKLHCSMKIRQLKPNLLKNIFRERLQHCDELNIDITSLNLSIKAFKRTDIKVR